MNHCPKKIERSNNSKEYVTHPKDNWGKNINRHGVPSFPYCLRNTSLPLQRTKHVVELLHWHQTILLNLVQGIYQVCLDVRVLCGSTWWKVDNVLSNTFLNGTMRWTPWMFKKSKSETERAMMSMNPLVDVIHNLYDNLDLEFCVQDNGVY